MAENKNAVRYNSRNLTQESQIVQNKICMHFMIKGKVQGVWFRASTQDEAKALGITGFARNTEDGHVEVVACGDKEKMMQFCTWLQKGPELARVDHVESKEFPWEDFDRFYVK